MNDFSCFSFTFGGFVNCVISASGLADAQTQIDEGVALTLLAYGIDRDEALRLVSQSLPNLEALS